MKYLTKNKYWKLNKEYNIDKILYLLIDRPDHNNEVFNVMDWRNKNQYHRNYDLPSFISSNYSLEWIHESKTYRSNGKPGIIWINGDKE